jgi:hypothetical protein
VFTIRFSAAEAALKKQFSDGLLVLMMGKVSFSAIISGDDLFEGQPQPLVTVVCFNSHFFFLREKDLFEASVAA